MAYSEIDDESIGLGDILTVELVRRLRDNPLAIAKGAVSAARERIEPYALNAFRQSFSHQIPGGRDGGDDLSAGQEFVARNFLADSAAATVIYIVITSVQIPSPPVSGAIEFSAGDLRHGIGFYEATFKNKNNVNGGHGEMPLTINADAYYFRDHLWIPDAQRPA